MTLETQCHAVSQEQPPHPLLAKDRSSHDQSEIIVDIGGSKLQETMINHLEEKLLQMHGHQLTKTDGSLQRLLPSPLLSDDKGLTLWRQINRLPYYYQTCDEVELFQVYGEDIAKHVPDGASIIDLGCGDIRKIKPFLDVLEANQKRVQYFGLDLSWSSLQTGMQELAPKYNFVQCKALWGLFHEGLRWMKNIPSPRWICSLGSSLGNDWFTPAVANLSLWSSAMEPGDRMLLGMDSCKDTETLRRSYHDEKGLFEAFIRNGLDQAARVLGKDWYRPEDWAISGIFHETPVMHQFAITAINDVCCNMDGVVFNKGTQIDCYEAFKYDPEEMSTQFKASGFGQVALWQSPSGRIFQYLLVPQKSPGN